MGCIVPFDRSQIADRRTAHCAAEPGSRTAGPQAAAAPAQARSFTVTGDLIARVDNLADCEASGRWKELELYRTPERRYVCLEIWRNTREDEPDQYWMATCDDLQAARDFFGSNRLASELFSALAS